jgi:hypothetical protein
MMGPDGGGLWQTSHPQMAAAAFAQVQQNKRLPQSWVGDGGILKLFGDADLCPL